MIFASNNRNNSFVHTVCNNMPQIKTKYITQHKYKCKDFLNTTSATNAKTQGQLEWWIFSHYTQFNY